MWSVGPLTAMTDCCWSARPWPPQRQPRGSPPTRPPAARAAGQRQDLRGIAANDGRSCLAEQLLRQAGPPSQGARGDRVEHPWGARLLCTGDREVHRAGGVVIRRAEVDQHAPRDGRELAGLVGVVDHGGSGADGEQDVGGPPRHDDVGQALDQGGLPRSAVRASARSCGVTVEVALTVLTSLR